MEPFGLFVLAGALCYSCLTLALNPPCSSYRFHFGVTVCAVLIAFLSLSFFRYVKHRARTLAYWALVRSKKSE